MESSNEQWLMRRIASSVKRLEKEEHLISKDISSLIAERDSLESRLLSVEGLISSKLKERQEITDSIAARRAVIGSTVRARPAITKKELETRSPSIFTPQLNERISILLRSKTPVYGPLMEQGYVGTTLSSPSPLSDPTSESSGFGVVPEWERAEWPTSACQEHTLKIQEPSGGTDIDWNELSLWMTSENSE